jgi:hypothetical protein
MDEHALKNIVTIFVVPLLVFFFGRWLWKCYTKKIDRKQIYIPLLNKFSKSLTRLLKLINQNHPRELAKDTFGTIYEDNYVSSEYLNLPSKIQCQLKTIIDEKNACLESLNILIRKVSALKSNVVHEAFPGNSDQFYIINFILLDKAPNSGVQINFPVDSGSRFHCIYCDERTAFRIHKEANGYSELAEYKKQKDRLVSTVEDTLQLIKKEQKV